MATVRLNKVIALLEQGKADIQKHFAVYDALARRGEPPVTAY